jgi:hypothetical protein
VAANLLELRQHVEEKTTRHITLNLKRVTTRSRPSRLLKSETEKNNHSTHPVRLALLVPPPNDRDDD